MKFKVFVYLLLQIVVLLNQSSFAAHRRVVNSPTRLSKGWLDSHRNRLFESGAFNERVFSEVLGQIPRHKFLDRFLPQAVEFVRAWVSDELTKGKPIEQITRDLEVLLSKRRNVFSWFEFYEIGHDDFFPLLRRESSAIEKTLRIRIDGTYKAKRGIRILERIFDYVDGVAITEHSASGNSISTELSVTIDPDNRVTIGMAFFDFILSHENVFTDPEQAEFWDAVKTIDMSLE